MNFVVTVYMYIWVEISKEMVFGLFVITVSSSFPFFLLSPSPLWDKELHTPLSVFGNSTGQNPGTRHQFWRSIQPLAGMSSSLKQFLPKLNHTAPSVELREPPLFATLWISFYPNSGVLVSSDQFNWGSRFGWNLCQKKKKKKKKNAFYGENSSCCNQKNTKRVKQHFRFSYNKFFSRQLSLLAQLESDREGEQRRNQIRPDSVRGTTMYPCLLLLKGLFSRFCWQNYQDPQNFYFYLLVLIIPARLNKSFFAASTFPSDRSKCLSSLWTLQFFSPKINVYLRPPKNMSVSL